MFVWHHHSLLITQFFSHYLWAPYLSPVQLFHFFFQYPNSLNPVKKKKKKKRTDRTSEKKKKKRTEQPTQEKKKRTEQPTQKKNKNKKKKKKKNSQPRKRKKKVKRWSKVAAVGPYVCLITILSLSYGN